MFPSRVILPTLFCAILTACQSTTISPANHPLTGNWILLPEPSVNSGITLGSAYDLEGGLNVGCYTVTQTADSLGGNTWDRMEFRWQRSSSDSLFLRVANLLNADVGLRNAEGAYLRLDSVRVLRAADPSPLSSCGATSEDGLPVRPAVTALIGAKSYTLHTWNKSQSNLAAQAVATGTLANTGGQRVRVKEDSAVVSFNSFRWIGAQFTGFNAVLGEAFAPIDTFNLGEIVRVPPRFELRVVWVEGPLYQVISRTIQPIGSWIIERVEPNQTFSLGRSTGSSTRGVWMDARIRVDENGRVILLAENRGFRTETFIGEESRTAMEAWIRNRKP